MPAREPKRKPTALATTTATTKRVKLFIYIFLRPADYHKAKDTEGNQASSDEARFNIPGFQRGREDLSRRCPCGRRRLKRGLFCYILINQNLTLTRRKHEFISRQNARGILIAHCPCRRRGQQTSLGNYRARTRPRTPRRRSHHYHQCRCCRTGC